MSDNVDWGLALRLAKAGLGGEPAGRPPLDLGHLHDDAVTRIARRTQLHPTDVPPLEWIDREAWAAMNLASMRSLLAPALGALDEAPGLVRGLGGAVVAAELGGLLALLGRRVLGQFDLRPRDPDDPRRLVLVAPNLRGAAEELGLDLVALTTWVGVHEVTHAVQFSGAPWLRDHLAGLVGELVDSAGGTPDLRGLLRAGPADLKALALRVRDQGLAGLVLDERRLGTLDRVQATMALVEGHAEWTMDAVGRDVVPDVGTLRLALERRRGSRGPLFEVLDRLLGLEMKLRQYRDGRAFCEAVAAVGGDDLVRRAWDGPEAIPTTAELRDPQRWVARMAA